MNRFWLLATGTGLLILGWTELPVWGHGAIATYKQTLTISSKYDTGEPFANAQVVVYSPNNVETPWLTGATNAQGEFSFTPDTSQPGNWEVMVRQAGHGQTIVIPIGSGENMAIGSGGNIIGSSLLSKLLAGGAAIWGFIGTALFFLRGKQT